MVFPYDVMEGMQSMAMAEQWRTQYERTHNPHNTCTHTTDAVYGKKLLLNVLLIRR